MTYSVYRRRDLESVIVPFFEQHSLVSRKREDFAKFAEIVRLMQTDGHRTREGFRRIVELAFFHEPARQAAKVHARGSASGTLRDCTPSIRVNG